MYTDRTFEGKTSRPWQGGQYGFVRTPVRTKLGVVYSKFHEGIDIAPVARTSAGEPLDTVMSMAPGKVVHCNTNSRFSNYGRYVVVQHSFPSGPFYSLYAHLKSIAVKPGQRVRAGTPLGVMGYTGVGINRRRAHVHVELNMLLHSNFDKWHLKVHGTANKHGQYNGLNLSGLNLSKALKSRGGVSLSGMVRGQSPYYKVLVPNTGKIELLQRYPWLGTRGAARAPAYEISLTGDGIPVKFTPHKRRVDYPVVSWVRYSPTYHKYFTKKRLSGSGSSAKLTKSGRQYIDLLIGGF